MPSSTSSSDSRALPAGNWGGIWLVALVLAAAGTFWFERTTRSHGQRPSVADDAVWWALHRHGVGPNDVVFLGTSRMQVAYSAEAFAQAAPELRGIQLSINGVPAFGALEDLAADESFHGVAVVDFVEWELARADAFTGADEYVARAHALWRAPGALVNRWLASHAQAHLAVLSVGGREIIASGIGQRRWPEPKWVVSNRDRSGHGDYSLASPAALQKRRDKGLTTFSSAPMPPDAWLKAMERVEVAVQKIQARGGKVVLLRLPITGKLAEAAEQSYPRARYWDVFAGRTAATMINSRDLSAVAPLVCPDNMHLDQRDQDTFTRAIVETLRSRGLLANR